MEFYQVCVLVDKYMQLVLFRYYKNISLFVLSSVFVIIK